MNDKYQSQGFPPYKWSYFESSPWTDVKKPLEETTVALISSAGIFRDDQTPFDPWAVNDLSFREIPVDTPFEKLRLHHNYFDHRNALEDMNCVYPIHRLQEMVEEKAIGSLAPTVISLGMGRLYKRTALQNETAVKITAVLERQNTDVAFLIPS